MPDFFSRLKWIRIVAIVLSLAAGVVFYEIWQIKRDVDAVASHIALDPGPQSTLIYDSKDRLISALYREHRIPVAQIGRAHV